MRSTPNQRKKLKLGKKTDSGYEYSAKIDFKEDLASQIANLMQEKKVVDELETQIEQFKEIASGFKHKEKDLTYYSTVGKALGFLDGGSFKNVQLYGVFRRLVDEVPEILPSIEDKKRIPDHLMMMYRTRKLSKGLLSKARWDQWYEITKFKNVVDNRSVLERVLKICEEGISARALRERIKLVLMGGKLK